MYLHLNQIVKMKLPYNYNIATLSPQGISKELHSYLNAPISLADGSPYQGKMVNRDYLAQTMLAPFEKSNLPFCCTFLGWSTIDNEQPLIRLMSLFDQLTITNGEDCVSAEGFSRNLGNGIMQIKGAYPLLDISDNRTDEYNKISFLGNQDMTNDLFTSLHKTFVNGALQSDQLGVVCAVIANSNQLAEEKIQEIYNLFKSDNLSE